MIFNSLQFLIFFPLVTLLYFAFPQRVRWVWLLVASYYFYMCWNPRYAVLIAASTAITFLSGILIDRENRVAGEGKRKRRKKLWVALSFLLNLAILFFFKYWGFFSDNMVALGGLAGVSIELPKFDVLLPVGISFYTFQALSYTMDVYRGEIYAERNLFKYALFVSFFPQLVAGPIERSKNLLVQVNEPHSFDPGRVRDGLLLMLWGFFQKVVIADRIGVLVDHVYNHWNEVAGISIVVATVLFAVQIYCDFGGYSDIAIGAAQVLGFSLMKNFNQPYLSKSCGEFWRRWHISLSSWFRDYLYIPLGGNRKGKWRKYFNNLATFAVSGLWHGAAWTFILWGALHGVAMVAARLIKARTSRRLPLLPAWLLTFAFVNLCWVFFRAPTIAAGGQLLSRLALGGWGALPESLTGCFLTTEFSSLGQFIPLDSALFAAIVCVLFLLAALAGAVFPQNMQQRLLRFRPSVPLCLGSAALLFWSVLSLSGVSTFLYFTF